MIDMLFCVNCGTKLATQWNICPQCGTKKVDKTPTTIDRLSAEDFSEDGEWYWNGDKWIPVIYDNTSKITQKKVLKSIGLAYFLNFVIPGLGNLYLRELPGGIGWLIYMIGWLILAVILPFPEGWALAAIFFTLYSCGCVPYDYRKSMRIRR